MSNNRDTIDYGIDLGTTNSAIAVLRGTIPEIIKNNRDHDITPSCVSIDQRGLHVGLKAREHSIKEQYENDAFSEFKRRMGSDFVYEFVRAARRMTPEELSGEVLKELRGSVQQKSGEIIEAAVITVPAAFLAGQCAATKKAAELAGLSTCPLVQEPVAAALAYGFQRNVGKGYWLVYDFGGGTFDAAIIKTDDGSITVVNHGGDNFLGGSDIDWAIVDSIIAPALGKQYNLPDFTRGNKRWATTFRKIKRSAENAKIELSRSESAFLEDCIFKDGSGKEIELEFKLERDSVIRAAEPIIMKSVEIAKRVLKEKNLSPGSIDNVILVGGPTLAPYFREMLSDSLGARLDFSVDPLTVVARGAAVFAGTQRLDARKTAAVSKGSYRLELNYKPVGADEDPTVRGQVIGPEESDLTGFGIQFTNSQSHWVSGKVPLRQDGRFKTNLLAERGNKNTFTIELFDSRGTLVPVEPTSISYTIGLAISEQPIIHSIAVATAGNESDVFFKKGDTLPAKATKVYHSNHAIRKGETGDLLRVPVVEGELDLADRNRLLGYLEIAGKNIRRDLPAGTEVEVTLTMDASRIIRTKAYVPLLDEEFEATIDYNKHSPEPNALAANHEREMKRLQALKTKASTADEDDASEQLEEMENSQELEELNDLLKAAQADPDAAHKAETDILAIRVRLDKVEEQLEWPATVASARETLDRADELAEECSDDAAKGKIAKLREEIEEAINQKQADRVRKRVDSVLEIERELYFAQPGFWVGYYQHMEEQRAKMKDQELAERLFHQGHQHISSGNVDGLRAVVAQLMGLLPREVAADIQRGYQSGLVRKL